MVTKAIERAQNTVEQECRGSENVLKYDEVMNEQRKVIYARRSQILNGKTYEKNPEYIESAVAQIVDQFCGDEDHSEWDLEGFTLRPTATGPLSSLSTGCGN